MVERDCTAAKMEETADPSLEKSANSEVNTEKTANVIVIKKNANINLEV